MQGYAGRVAVEEAAHPRVFDEAAGPRLSHRDGRVKGLELLNPPINRRNRPGPPPPFLPQVKSLQLKPVRAKTPKFHGPMLVSQVSGVTRHKVRLRSTLRG